MKDEMRHYRLVVLTAPMPGQDAEYNRWYDQDHLPDVLRIPGFVGASRFRKSAVAFGSDGFAPYLALYDIQTADIESVLADMQARADTDAMPISPSLDQDSIKVAVYERLRST